jgi:hypothetical protein
MEHNALRISRTRVSQCHHPPNKTLQNKNPIAPISKTSMSHFTFPLRDYPP